MWYGVPQRGYTTMMKLYQNIKRLREELGLSQAELGEMVGYSRSAICRIEKGDFGVPQSKIIKFAEVFAVTAGDLMGWTDSDGGDYWSPEEKALIYRFRMLNSAGRKNARARIDDLTLIQKYLKTDS